MSGFKGLELPLESTTPRSTAMAFFVSRPHQPARLRPELFPDFSRTKRIGDWTQAAARPAIGGATESRIAVL